MWRWCLWTVQHVCGFATAPLLSRTCSLSNRVSLHIGRHIKGQCLSHSHHRPISRVSRNPSLDVASAHGDELDRGTPCVLAEGEPSTMSSVGNAVFGDVPANNVPRVKRSLLAASSGTAQTANAASEVSSADRLRELLALPSPRKSTSFKPTFNQIRDLYYSASARRQLASFTPEQFSALICLLGSLSVSTLQHPYSSLFTHPLASRMYKSSYRPHWALVRRVAHDKYALWKKLDVSDHYWLMRANLIDFQGAATEESIRSSTRSRDDALQLATRDYLCIRWHPHIEIHAMYLEALLSSPTTEHVDETVRRLCQLLAWYHDCRPRLQAILWQVLLRRQDELPAVLKEMILRTVWRRISNPTFKLQDRADGIHPPFSADLETDVPRHKPIETLDVSALASLLKGTIFIPRLRSAPPLVSQWAHTVTCAVFSPDNSVDLRWSCLVLMGIANSSLQSGRGHGATITHNGGRGISVADWQTICVLESVGKLFHDMDGQTSVAFSDDIWQKLSRILETLFSSWSSAVDQEQGHPFPIVSRIFLAEFFRFAGLLKNRRLREICDHSCQTWRLWTADVDKMDVAERHGLSFLAQAQLTSSLLCGTSVESALSFIIDHVGDAATLSRVLSITISTLCRRNVDMAAELRVVARRVGIEISADSVTNLAISLASQGSIKSALELLEDGRLTPEQHLSILRKILFVIVHEGHRFRSAYFTSAVGDAMLKQFSFNPPPTNIRPVLQPALLWMPRFRQSSSAVAIVEAISNAQTSYFSGKFMTLLLDALLRHRQYRLAVRVYNLAIRLHRTDSLPSRSTLALRLSGHGAGTLARGLAGRLSESELQSSAISFACMLRFRETVPSTATTLKIPKFLSHARVRSGPINTRALLVLVRASRLRAAKQLYSQLREEQSEASRTAIGNSILHASLLHHSRHNGQRMRKGLYTLKELTDNFGFVPDRVTVNILLKGLMLWTSVVNSGKLRILFDHMVRGGYPTGGIAFRTVVPFGTPVSAQNILNIPQVHSPVSFVRHVRPLYRMFIKAFYIRGDVEAARTVIYILKAVEAEEVDLMESRGNAKSVGPQSHVGERDDGHPI